MNARALVLASFACTSSSLFAQAADPAPPRTGWLDETITVAGTEHRYVLYVPREYTPDRRWPLIVFLHGRGECGTDGQKQVTVGLGPVIRRDPAAWPFLVLYPQKPDRASQWEDHDAMVMAMLERSEKDWAIDPKLRFLTGLSQGGHGAWVLGARHAGVWAAIAPVCGYGEPREIAPALKAMPIWCFHGEDDRTVPPEQSKDLCAAVEKAGGRAELTLYPGVGHNSWDKAYGGEPLAEWLLAAASDPVRAAYVARPQQANRARLTVRHTWSGIDDKDQPARGTKTIALELDDTNVTWRVAIERPQTAAAPREGRLRPSEGKEVLLRELRALQAAAVFRLPDPVKPASVRTMPKATNEFRVEVSLDGPPGAWRFQRDVPTLAEFDDRFTPQVRALIEFVRRIEALR